MSYSTLSTVKHRTMVTLLVRTAPPASSFTFLGEGESGDDERAEGVGFGVVMEGQKGWGLGW